MSGNYLKSVSNPVGGGEGGGEGGLISNSEAHQQFTLWRKEGGNSGTVTEKSEWR